MLAQQYQMACQQGDYETAVKKFNSLLAIAETIPGMSVEDYTTVIAQHLNLLLSINKIEEARNLLQHANEFVSGKLAKDPADLRSIESLYGLFSIYTFDYDGALKHYLRSKELYNSAGDESPQYYAIVLNPLFNVYLALKDYAFAKLIADEFSEYVKSNKVYEYFQSKGIELDPTSEAAQEFFLMPSMRLAQLGYVDEALEMIKPVVEQLGKKQIGVSSDNIRMFYAGLLMLKGDFSKAKEMCGINWEIGLNPSVIKGSLAGLVMCCIADTSMQALDYLNHLNNMMRRDAEIAMSDMTPLERQNYWENMMSLPSINYGVLNVFQKSNEVAQMAYDIAIYAKSMQDKYLHETVTWKEVKKTLSKNEVAIEFVMCPTEVMENNSPLRVGALILRKESKSPLYVDLCDLEDVDLFREAHVEAAKVNKYYSIDNTLLYRLIWQKITSQLKEGDVVYYSTMGVLSYLNLEVVSDGQYRMNQHYTFHQVSSTASIGELKTAKWKKTGGAVIYGGLIYDESVEIMQAAAKAYHYLPDEEILAMRSLYHDDVDSRGAINILSGTLEEAEFIRDILVKNGNDVTLFTEERGNEESVKALSGHAPYILHIATHGFFLTSPQDAYQHKSIIDRLDVLDNRQQSLMLHTGLLMSGAYNAWMGHEIPAGMEDGILTSYELSQINLSGCRLAVLSACETGRGVTNSFAGDLGLRHALKLANVQTIIVSLWEVPDEATSFLMKTLYESLCMGKEPSEALFHAQETVRAKFPQPYYWAGFQIID